MPTVYLKFQFPRGQNLPTLLGYLAHPIGAQNSALIGDLFPDELAQVERLFKLRHMYAHELATKEHISVRSLENLISAAATFVSLTEDFVTEDWQIEA